MKITGQASMWFEHMTNDQMLLTLCIRKEDLEDPAAWCQELRTICRASTTEPKTVLDAEALMKQSAALRYRIKSKTRS